jgi:RecA/RadA recombinase
VSELTKSDYDILLLHVVKDPTTFMEFVTKTDEPVFDPVQYMPHDFIAKVVRDLYYEHQSYMPPESLRYRITERLEDENYDPEINRKILELFDNIAAIPEAGLSQKISNTILQRVIDTQIASNTNSRLQQVLDRGLSASQALAEATQEMEKKRVGISNEVQIIKPFKNIQDCLIHTELFPTGVEFFDTMLGGGPWRHDLIGFLAPSSGGKTTFSVQLSTSWVRQGDDRQAVVLSYEQPVKGDIGSRLCSAATGISVNRFRGRDFSELDDEAKAKLEADLVPIQDRYTFADLSQGLGGTRGIEDIKTILDGLNLPEEGPPTLVIIDWFMPCVQRAMIGAGVNSHTNEALRMFGNRFMDDLKIMKNNRNVVFFITHQLESAKAGASSNRKPNWTEAAEWKAFAWFMDVCFAVGNMSEEGIGYFCASKTRAVAKSDKLVKLKGDLVKFVSAENDFMTSNGKIVPKVQMMDDMSADGQHNNLDVSHLKDLDNSAAAQFGGM